MTGRHWKNTETHKFCPRCQTLKPRPEFYNDRSTFDGLNARCKPCTHERGAAKRRGENMDARVGLYESLLAKQRGVCAICSRTDNGRWGDRRFSIDHDHRTKQVRGLICHRCNLLIGHFNDNPTLLRRAADYMDATYECDHPVAPDPLIDQPLIRIGQPFGS